MSTVWTCSACGAENCGMLCGNDKVCADCWNKRTDAWRAKLAVRQDPAQFDVRRLVNLMLSSHWMHECKIELRRAAGRRDETTVYWTAPDGLSVGLRHSKGPLQGYSWDSYSDDFQSPELALLALSQAPAPPRVDYAIPTHGN